MTALTAVTIVTPSFAASHENANKDANVYNTQRDLTAGAVAKKVGLEMLPPHVAEAHTAADIHFHDLDYHPFQPMTNCCLADFEGMLGKGFRIGNADVCSPNSIGTATAQIAQIIANIASTQYGGVTVDRIDELLAPYAAKNWAKHEAEAARWVAEEQREDYVTSRTAKDIFDAMQSLEYEVNTLFSSNGQTPFVSIGFGLGDSWFEQEIQRAIFQVRIAGLGVQRRTAIFPKLIFTLRSGLNLEPGTPGYDIKQLALQCAAQRMYPDVLSYDKIVEITGSFKAPMGCRSFLHSWTDPETGAQVNGGRMNLGVITVNLPRIALEAAGDLDLFWEVLDARLTVAGDGLAYRIRRVAEARPENAPILYMHGGFGERLPAGGDVTTLFDRDRSTISLGYIGLYEAATAFFGPAWENNPEAKRFTLDILRRMNERTRVWTEESGIHHSVYSTPSESLTDRFARADAAKFGSIEDITDKGYYTNSFHYDVRKAPTPFAKLDFEAEYAPLAPGGFIHYVEYPVLRHNTAALEAVWDYAYTRVGYLGTNTPIDSCHLCSYDGDFEATDTGFRCPSCGNTDPATVDVVKRTCGYLGNPAARPMVAGRHKEIVARVKHLPDARAAHADHVDRRA